MKLTQPAICYHPEWFLGNRPAPVEMIGLCEHNQSCPICGHGWGCTPDPCELIVNDDREVALCGTS
jgi:hypothetical protein